MSAEPLIFERPSSRVVAPRVVRTTESLFRRILEEVSDGVYFVDRDRRISYWNKGAEKISGYDRWSVLGRRCSDGILRHCSESGDVLCETSCPLEQTMRDGEPRDLIAYIQHRLGHRVPVRVRSSAVHDEEGTIVGCVEIFQDSSAALAVIQELTESKRDAMLDPLTAIPNRRFIEERLESIVQGGVPSAVLFIDLDSFKKINDDFGHAAGDAALRVVADTLRTAVRTFDIVGRWGGEEFVVIAPDSDLEDACLLGERLRGLIAECVLPLANGPLRLTASIGATETRPNEHVDEIVRRVDGLMYASKRAGRNRCTAG